MKINKKLILFNLKLRYMKDTPDSSGGYEYLLHLIGLTRSKEGMGSNLMVILSFIISVPRWCFFLIIVY